MTGLSKTSQSREYDKFALTSQGETAVRVILADPEGSPNLKSYYYVNDPISALKIVRAIDKDTIEIADVLANNIEESSGFGITLQGGPAGSRIQVVTFGKVEDAFFNFPLNAKLFLGPSGSVTNIPPLSGFFLEIGHSLGPGAIFINIKTSIARR